MQYTWGPMACNIDTFVDANRAGCLRTRKSTIGGAILIGGKYLKGWAKTMPVLALSTGESELAAVTKGISESLGVQAVLRDFGMDIAIHVKSDATAAIGICRRLGLGRIRHLATADLWCQQVVKNGQVRLSKWPGKQNPADLFTKFLGREDTLAHLGRMSMVSISGRAKCAPVRAGTVPCVKPSEFDPDICFFSDDIGDGIQLRQITQRTQCNTHELTSPKGPEGLGGYANPPHVANCALTYYDMVDDRC